MKKIVSKNRRLLWLFFPFLVIFIAGNIVYEYSQLNGNLKINLKPQSNTPALKSVEIEPNETFDEASPLKAGYETQGTLSTGQDIDIYWFTLEKPATVTFTSRNLPQEYDLDLFNAEQVQIASTKRNGFTDGTSTLVLQTPGKYYVKITTLYTETANLPYTLILTVRPFLK